MTGRIKYFDAARFFGFIEPKREKNAEIPDDIFFHVNDLQNRFTDVRKCLPGQEVKFNTRQSLKGPQATNIEIL